MENNTFYNEILIDHNMHPMHKLTLPVADKVLEGINPSCGDDIILQLKFDGDTITDAAFNGHGCAVSQAAADILAELVIGMTKSEAIDLIERYKRMIHNQASEEDLEILDEAVALQDIAHMPARVKCAELAWNTMASMISEEENKD